MQNTLGKENSMFKITKRARLNLQIINISTGHTGGDGEPGRKKRRAEREADKSRRIKSTMLQSLHFHLRAMENERRLYTRKREKYLGPRHGMYFLAGLFCYGICYLNAGSCCHDLHFYFLFVYDICILSHLSSHPDPNHRSHVLIQQTSRDVTKYLGCQTDIAPTLLETPLIAPTESEFFFLHTLTGFRSYQPHDAYLESLYPFVSLRSLSRKRQLTRIGQFAKH